MVGAFWRGEVSLRELRVMVEGLPPDSAVHRAMLGHTWTSARDWQTAEIRDLLADLLVSFINANRGEKSPPVQPLPRAIRPGDEERENEAEANERAEREAHNRLSRMLLKGG